MDRINISIEGMNSQQYLDFSKANVNFEKLVENITFSMRIGNNVK
ncbi:hypothetical protein [Brachyspira hyodysenteriae]|nr:hypothetical protein [Brachyspira hyodysenteriae]MCZ9957419.1 hypothetical protein [Brachyspira hyodysenteriae]